MYVKYTVLSKKDANRGRKVYVNKIKHVKIHIKCLSMTHIKKEGFAQKHNKYLRKFFKEKILYYINTIYLYFGSRGIFY